MQAGRSAWRNREQLLGLSAPSTGIARGVSPLPLASARHGRTLQPVRACLPPLFVLAAVFFACFPLRGGLRGVREGGAARLDEIDETEEQLLLGLQEGVP